MAHASSAAVASDEVGLASEIDGNTLEIGGTTIRLDGIDAPEHGQNCGGWRCGVAATGAMAPPADGVILRYEALPLEGYGSAIATCWSDDADIGAQMVQDGLAWAFVRYSDAYVAEEEEARRSARRLGSSSNSGMGISRRAFSGRGN